MRDLELLAPATMHLDQLCKFIMVLMARPPPLCRLLTGGVVERLGALGTCSDAPQSSMQGDHDSCRHVSTAVQAALNDVYLREQPKTIAQATVLTVQPGCARTSGSAAKLGHA